MAGFGGINGRRREASGGIKGDSLEGSDKTVKKLIREVPESNNPWCKNCESRTPFTIFLEKWSRTFSSFDEEHV